MDGVIKLAVNGKFVNGISKATQKKGYICLESEGAKIYFRNIRIMELPPGGTAAKRDRNTIPLFAREPNHKPATIQRPPPHPPRA